MTRLSRIGWIAAAALTLALLLAAAFSGLPGYLHGKLRARHAPSAASTSSDTRSFAWLKTAMDNCEKDAGRNPDTVSFMIVPMAAAGAYGREWSTKALEIVGNTVLFDSQSALEGLNAGAMRISSLQFVFSVLDTATNATHRWNSAVGVSTLSSKEIAARGTFKVGFQTAPGEKPVWSSVTATGDGTCHWVFALVEK